MIGRHLLAAGAICMASIGAASAGPYAPAAGQLGSTAISKDSLAIVGWATDVVNLTRGYQDVSFPDGGAASFGTAADALGPAEGTSYSVVSLGDAGSITLSFANPITNGAGADFAVFENSFSDDFLELAFVEVSSNGNDFFRFPAVSLTGTTTQIGTYDTLDPTNLYNLAGKYRQGYGTPFDLSELAGVSPLLNINSITQVRVVDVCGSLDPLYGSYDSQGHLVNDPWTTEFPSGGFDLDGVAVLYAVPEPTSIWLMLPALAWTIRRRRE